MAALQSIVDRARITLVDVDKTRYPDDEMLGYALDGLREICVLRPDLFSVNDIITCIAGVKQSVPSVGWFIVDVFGTVNGDEITEGDYGHFRSFNPGWRNDAIGPAEFWMRIPTDANKAPNAEFYVYPKQDPGVQLNACWTELDTDLAIGDDAPIEEQYHPALIAYVIFRAETKDDEHVVAQRAALFRQGFEGLLGMGSKTEKVESP